MRLLFKQRFFSWFDSYDVYNEKGEPIYTVKGQLSWGHCLKIFDFQGEYVGTVKERIFTFLPKFEMYLGDSYFGCISKEFSLFAPRYHIDCCGWYIEGDIFSWDYNIYEQGGGRIATVSKQLFRLTDTYVIDVPNEQDVLCALMLVLAIDAEKCGKD